MELTPRRRCLNTVKRREYGVFVCVQRPLLELDLQLINLLLWVSLAKIHTILLASSLAIYLALERAALVVALTIVIINVN